jgi:DNA-binding GntR family transcriptional regulator
VTLKSFVPELTRRADLWELVAVQLRRAIITGELAPGVHMNEPLLARGFGVSRVPVREALVQLEHEGLVRSEPGRGSFVVGMSPTDVQEFYDLRLLIEVQAGRLAARRATVDDVGALEETMAVMRRASQLSQSEQFFEADVTFHRQIVVASGHRRLASVWETLSGIAYTLLCVTDLFALSHDQDEIIQTHQDIVDGLKAGDPDTVEVELRHHLTNGATKIRNLLHSPK